LITHYIILVENKNFGKVLNQNKNEIFGKVLNQNKNETFGKVFVLL